MTAGPAPVEETRRARLRRIAVRVLLVAVPGGLAFLAVMWLFRRRAALKG